MPTFIIAEAGVNHNGDVGLALRLIEIAAQCGADAVKFQTFSAEKLAAVGAQKAEYQQETTGDGDQLSMLKKLELTRDEFGRLKARCDALAIEFMSTAFDEESLDFLVSIGIKRIKIPSGEITNLPFIAHCARKMMPIILSTGMSDLDEIEQAVACIRRAWKDIDFKTTDKEFLTILHCTSNYPAHPQDLNLTAMTTIAQKTGCPTGYSDHSQGIVVSPAAVALGASVIEKHYTLDKAMEGPDHKASLDQGELSTMIRDIRIIEQALGTGEKKPSESELPVRDVARKSIAVARDIPQGTVLSQSDLIMLRPGTGISPARREEIVGRKTKSALQSGALLDWKDIT
ncbi:N-acetylneuraminate synthase [Cohaesibacter celericrescens]|uniref:N-acetylneuraminate synthase n=1 Tax=Cohaesibacter celericrescens TaxID=2067669 RepID=A0A2N5XUK0_9HYPH|nr:N-acetylneuraminate synthase [Cohaesibacter celericrescens]PLW78137.1 N-acetylneuraminate synthase [Cohaesibacter celericrescens]